MSVLEKGEEVNNDVVVSLTGNELERTEARFCRRVLWFSQF